MYINCHLVCCVIHGYIQYWVVSVFILFSLDCISFSNGCLSYNTDKGIDKEVDNSNPYLSRIWPFPRGHFFLNKTDCSFYLFYVITFLVFVFFLYSFLVYSYLEKKDNLLVQPICHILRSKDVLL